MRRLLTFVLGGGKGERLWPLTRDRAKPAVPFGGIYRIIDFTLSNCVNSGIRKIHVLIQYKSISLQRHLRMGWNIFDSELGEFIDVIPAQQRVGEHWYLGTADAIFQNLYSVTQESPEDVLILAGDHVYKMDYGDLISFHRDRGAQVTVGVVAMPREESRGFGIVEVDRESRIVGFQEKPADPRPIPDDAARCCVSMGIYVFTRAVLEQVLEDDARRADSTHDFGRDVIPRLSAAGRALAYRFDLRGRPGGDYWRDIGTLDAYYAANMDLVQITPQFNLYDQDWPIRTYHEQWPPAKTVFTDEARHRVGMALESLVSNGCIISGGRVARCVLSPDVRVHSFAELEASVVMEHVQIGRHAAIRRAIIDKDVVIPQGTRIGYDLDEDRRRFHVTESGIVVVGKGTVIEGAATTPSLASA